MAKVTLSGKKGGLLVGKRHSDGGMPVIVKNVRNRPIEVEGGEIIITRRAAQKHWKLLSKINQDGGGVPIANPNAYDDDPNEKTMANGGTIKFRANHLPKKAIVRYAEKIRTKYPKVWELGGNIFGNEAFKNLSRVSDRGHWLPSEEWMYVKWRVYVARHQKDYRIEGVIAMLKWCDTVEKGWPYMKDLIEKEIDKRYGSGQKMEDGGGIDNKPKVVLELERMLQKKSYTEHTGSFYFDRIQSPKYGMVAIRVSNHPSKYAERQDVSGHNKRFDFSGINEHPSPERAKVIYDKVMGIDRLIDVENGDTLIHRRLGKMKVVSYDKDKGSIEVEGGKKYHVDAFTKNMENGGLLDDAVTKEDYYKETVGNFTPIKPAKATSIFNAYIKYQRLKNKPEFIEVEGIGKLKLDYESISKNAYHRSRGFSLYFLKGNSSVIRISDHWSESNYSKSQKLNCGSISTCYWTNFGEAFEQRMAGEKYASRFIAGEIKFSQLKRRQYTNYHATAKHGMLIGAAAQAKQSADEKVRTRRELAREFDEKNPANEGEYNWEREAAKSKYVYGYERGGNIKKTNMSKDREVTDIKILKESSKGAMLITDGKKVAWIMPKMKRKDGTFTKGAYDALSKSTKSFDDNVSESKDVILDFCEISRETEKAILARLRLSITEIELTKDIEVWFPKSKASVLDDKISINSFFWNQKKQEIIEKEQYFKIKKYDLYDNSFGISVITDEYITNQYRSGKIFIPKSVSQVGKDGYLYAPKWIVEKRLEEKSDDFKTGGFRFSSSINTGLNTDYELVSPEIISCSELKYTEPKSTQESDKQHEHLKGISYDYPNQYALNKAIEELLIEKGESPDSYTSDEKVFLRQYSGYGGLDKFGTTGKGGLFEYYTPLPIIEKMWALAYKHGYNNGSVLEPSVGTGEFFSMAPVGAKLTGFEISEYSSKICRILYPNATIIHQPFEQHFIKNNFTVKNNLGGYSMYDLVIGNPPYGSFDIVKSRFMAMGEMDYVKPVNYVEYFLRRSMDLLKPNGILVFIIGAELRNGGVMFLDSGGTSVKTYLSEQAELVEAYRLPDKVFERTGVTTDIIVLKKKAI